MTKRCFCLRSNLFALITVFLMLFISRNSDAAVRRMIGPNITMSWASSYLAIESGSVTVHDGSEWTYATALGWFFDYQLTTYISIRTNWFFYPTSLNGSAKDFNRNMGQIPLHEAGFAVLRHFNACGISPWFGGGPFVQLATPSDINSYIVHAMLSTGFDYEIDENVYFCPELMGGIGARIISRGANKDVQIDVPTGRGFSSSGMVIFFKIGIGRAF